MEPTPPKGSRNKRFVQNRPFYESSKKTSAEIISEARSTVRPLQTRRPETPLDLNNRSLFGKQREGRPPSAVSISSTFHDSRPPSGKGKLTPLSNAPDFKELESRLEERFTVDKKSNDVGNENNNNNNNNITKKEMKIKGNIIPKSAEPSFSRVRRSIKSSKVAEERRVHSGPKERTPIFRDDDLKRSNSYSDLTATSDDEKSTHTKHLNQNIDYDTFYKSNIEPLINQMHLNHEYGDIEALLVNMDVLWKFLEVGNMVGKSGTITKDHRTVIMTQLSSYVNIKNALLQLRICKLSLGLKVSKKNLSSVCKSFYQLTKNEKNDELVLQEKVIEPLLNILYTPEQVDNTADLVYLVGAVRILSNQPKCSKEMKLMEVLKPVKCLLLFSIKKYTTAVQIKESNHMLIQACLLLNNLADSATLANQFIGNDILQLLMDLMKTRLDDVDLIMPIASIFSKLTISESICNNIVEIESNPGLLMNTLIKHINQQEIVVRFGYAFGNMANHSPKFRSLVLSSNDITKHLIKVIRFYTKKLKKDRSQNENEKECEEDEDVLIKLIRVVANLSISEEGAVLFSNSEELIQVILALLESCDQLRLSQELVINTSATVNNMSFFNDSQSILVQNTENFTGRFLDILLTKNEECSVEAMRALGNFTQSEDSRRLLLRGKGLDVIIVLLDSSNLDLVFCACGVLINMMVDRTTRTLIKEAQAIPKLVDLLKNAVDVDWALVGLVCQILWNYTEEMNSTNEYFDDIDAEDLITTLTDFTDPSMISSMLRSQYSTNEAGDTNTVDSHDIDEETEEHFKESWGLFLPIGSSLLQRMEECHSHLEPLVIPPD